MDDFEPIDPNKPRTDVTTTIDIDQIEEQKGGQLNHDSNPEYTLSGKEEADLLYRYDSGHVNAFDISQNADESGIPIKKWNTAACEWEEARIKPVIDLRNIADPEGIRDGLRHPAVLADLNAYYMYLFRSVTGLGITDNRDLFIDSKGFLDRVEYLVQLRDNPALIYGEIFKKLGEGGRTDVEQWNLALAEKIEEYPKAFLFKDISYDYYGQHFPIAVVRPSEEDTDLMVFTPYGMCRISSDGFRGDRLIDLIGAINLNEIIYHSEILQKEHRDELTPRSIRRRILLYEPSSKNSDDLTRLDFIGRLGDKRDSSYKIDFRFGYSNKFEISEQEIGEINGRLQRASGMPWPEIEQPKRDKDRARTTESGTHFLRQL